MPITRRAFELGADVEEWMKEIYNFISEHKDEAFTLEELYEQWGISLPPFPIRLISMPTGKQYLISAITQALEKLVEAEAVEKKEIAGEVYYACGPNPLPI